jgi:hypothetical protein
MKPEGRPVSRAENFAQFDPGVLDWSSAEAITRSLALVNEAVLRRQITPNEGKSVAQVAAVSLKAIGLSVRSEIEALKQQFKRQEQEAKGPGRRKGIQ